MLDEEWMWEAFSRSDARAWGLSDRELARLINKGGWQRVRRGDYQLAPGPISREDRHRQLARATAARFYQSGIPPVISHGSAAVWHHLPVWRADLSRVHVTRPGSPGIASTTLIHPHRAQMADDEVVVIDGVAVTSVARTILDLARTCSFESAVVTADAALQLKLVSADELAAVVDRARSRRSAGAAPHVLNFADGRSESVGESRSRVLFARAGLPRPVLQSKVFSANGVELARVDFEIEEMRTVGEFDGLRKYGRDLRPGEEPEHAVVREKLREDAIRDTGREMVRWIWPDIDRERSLIDRFVRAFGRAGHHDWTPQPWLPWLIRRGSVA